MCRLIMTPRNPRTFVGGDGEPRHAAIDAALKFLSGNYQLSSGIVCFDVGNLSAQTVVTLERDVERTIHAVRALG
jgi:hypothetical protein